MRIIGTVGLPGSGKGEAAAVAREAGIPVVTMGDVIRAETRRRGLDPSEHHGEIAQQLREEEGEAAIADRCIPLVRDAAEDQSGEPVVLVDGLRSMAEVERFVDAFGEEFLLVSIEAPFDLRAKRLGDRGREATDLDREKLQEREERELGFGMGEVMDAADLTIENDDSLQAFREQVEAVLERGAAAVDERESAASRTQSGDGGERE